MNWFWPWFGPPSPHDWIWPGVGAPWNPHFEPEWAPADLVTVASDSIDAGAGDDLVWGDNLAIIETNEILPPRPRSARGGRSPTATRTRSSRTSST